MAGAMQPAAGAEAAECQPAAAAAARWLIAGGLWRCRWRRWLGLGEVCWGQEGTAVLKQRAARVGGGEPCLVEEFSGSAWARLEGLPSLGLRGAPCGGLPEKWVL
jgi:hypothetical protein